MVRHPVQEVQPKYVRIGDFVSGFIVARSARGFGGTPTSIFAVQKRQVSIHLPCLILTCTPQTCGNAKNRIILEYPEKVGQVFAETVGEVEGGEVPLLLQYDQRWGYGDYGNSSVAVSGCGPACLSMVITSLTGDDTITPYVVAQYASEQGYYVPGAGTAWTLMSEGAKHFGVIGEELPLTKSIMEGVLKEGRPIICSMRPGDFTTTGHFIVITGIKDGQFTVNDPNSTERSNMLWDYDTLKPQISNLWAFQAL